MMFRFVVSLSSFLITSKVQSRDNKTCPIDTHTGVIHTSFELTLYDCTLQKRIARSSRMYIFIVNRLCFYPYITLYGNILIPSLNFHKDSNGFSAKFGIVGRWQPHTYLVLVNVSYQ